MSIISVFCAVAAFAPPVVREWSLVRVSDALNSGKISSARLFPSGELSTLDVDGVTHRTMLLPSQAGDVANQFAEKHIELFLQPPSALLNAVRELVQVIPAVALGIIIVNIILQQSNGGIGMMRKKTNEPIAVEEIDTRFEDVAGLTQAKEELAEVVACLRDGDRVAAVGARVPRGVLLEGGPGNGKTLLARAVAGEAGVPFIPVTASSFVEMYVGLGAARIRSLFERAKSVAPCIIWIDEIDAVAKKRSSSAMNGAGNEERETTLNELLSAMDGFDKDTGIVVMAATNRADVLDEALLRPGRFDRRIAIGLPDAVERAAILKVHAQNKPLDKHLSLETTASMTAGFSGAQLANLLNEAAFRALRRNDTIIKTEDVDGAIYRELAGIEREDRLTAKTRYRVAVHEAGHAVVACVSGYDDVAVVTVVPRSNGAGGFTSFVPNEDQSTSGLLTRDYLEIQLSVLVAGRVAEEIVLEASTISTGASDDLRKAFRTARKMVTEWGMGDSLVAYDDSIRASIRTVDAIDQQVEELVSGAVARARNILQANKRSLLHTADRLIADKTIEGALVRNLIGD